MPVAPARKTDIQPFARDEGRYDQMNLSDWFAMLRDQARRDEGQTMAEYGVVLAVITLGVIAALGLLAVAITGKFDAVTGILDAAV